VRGLARTRSQAEEGLAVAVLANTNGDESDMTTIAGRIRAALTP
jgi:hypothetical protein